MASDSGTVEPEADDLVAVGDLIDGRYRIEELIARGGQASVWKASQEPLQRTVALKVLTAPPTREGSEPFRERFLLEAKTLASLNHPNIVIVYDYGRIASGCYYIAMEHVEGVRFSRILRQRPIDAARRLRLVSQVCRALRYAHQRGVIHRDVKNANILVRKDSAGVEEVKVVDFGIVKLMESDPGITQEGVILGSPHFMSPEQITGAFFDHRADIYAVGVLLYCSVTGRYPYRGKDARTIMTNHLKQPIPQVKSRDPRLVGDDEFENIVKRCLAKRPDNRYSDMDALIEALAPYASGERFEVIDLGAEALEELVDDVEDLITGRTERAEMALHPFHDGGNSMTAEMGAMLVDDDIEEVPAPTHTETRVPSIGVVDIEEIAGIQEVVRSHYDPEAQLEASEPMAAGEEDSDEDDSDAYATDAAGVIEDDYATDAAEAVPVHEPAEEALSEPEGDESESAEEASPEGESEEAAEEGADEAAVDEAAAEDEPAEAAEAEVAEDESEEAPAEDEDAEDAEDAAEVSEESSAEDDAPDAVAPEEDASEEAPPADESPAPAEEPPAAEPEPVKAPVADTTDKPPVVVPQIDEPVSDSRLFKLWIAAFVGTLLLAGVAGRMLGLF